MSLEIIQGTPEWHEARLGKVTASRIADLMAKTKSGWGASRANYMSELVVERLTGERPPAFTNEAMRWGTEKEPEARAAYEWLGECDVIQVGFAQHPTIAMSGASPDGLVGESGLVEIKCPNTATHIETLLGQSVPEKYLKQVQWQLACTGRHWCDWVSYDPRMPERMRLFVRRVSRDETAIKEMETAVTEFLRELDAKVEALRRRYGLKEAA